MTFRNEIQKPEFKNYYVQGSEPLIATHFEVGEFVFVIKVRVSDITYFARPQAILNGVFNAVAAILKNFMIIMKLKGNYPSEECSAKFKNAVINQFVQPKSKTIHA